MPEYLAPGVYIEETSFQSETDDTILFTETDARTEDGSYGYVYDDLSRLTTETDTAEAEGRDAPYVNYNFTVNWGANAAETTEDPLIGFNFLLELG